MVARDVNSSVVVIVRAFKVAVAREKVSPEAVAALECVKPLRRGEELIRQIGFVCSDMWQAYRKVILKKLPAS